MPEIVITEFMDEASVDGLRSGREVLYDPGLADRQDEIAPLLADCRALVVRNRTLVTARLMDASPGLTCIGRLGVGLDNIDVDAARARGIAVYPATGANNLSVAEYVVTAAMVLLRGAWFASGEVAAGSWPRQRLIGREISGKAMGLVGYGAIARETARRAQALGMTVLACDPLLPAGDPAWAGVERHDLAGLLSHSDVVSLHVPLTDETRHLIGAEALSRMKRDAILVNAARGGVVDEAALAHALMEGRLGGAALDVFENEPLDAQSGHAFAGLSNVILTPHIAGVTAESNVRVSEMIADLVRRRLEEQP